MIGRKIPADVVGALRGEVWQSSHNCYAWPMTRQETGNFCYDFEREADGATRFRCSDDDEQHPWLRLHPADNVAVQSTNYFALTGVSRFTNRMDGTKWTALTRFEWRTHQTGSGARHPARGRATHGEDGIGYGCQFFDADDNPVYDVSGAGVVFKTRDFEGWRAKAKAKILALPEPENFAFAAPREVGVETQVEVFVSPLAEDAAGVYADAILTATSGFRPTHPYHGGSGDHVNSGQLCDAVQQAARLIRGPGHVAAGEAVFSRYVELERPFQVRLLEAASDHRRLDFSVEQADEKCAAITFHYDD